jgi:uncharacterized repeat protein (TIGR03803 family)
MAKIQNLTVALPLVALAAALSAADAPARSQFRVVAAFGAYSQPGGLAEGDPDVFYSFGGTAPDYAFSVTAGGTLTQLAAFPNGYIVLPLVSASNARFYGMVVGGGGSVCNAFSVDSHANSLISYSQQAICGSLNQSLPDGTMLGVGLQESTGAYSVFKSDLQGNVTPIYQFPHGEQLPNNVIYASDGNYYGAAWQRYDGGSTNTAGYIYQLTPSGTLTKLYNLPPGTFASLSNFVPILQAKDGNFYSVTTQGGANGFGSVYQLTPSGQFTTIYSFTGGQSAYPEALIQASDGNLYAASLGNGYGQISRITTAGQYTLLHTMAGASGSCVCLIIQGSDGVIYGTAGNNGPQGGGDVFALNLGLPKPAPQALSFTPAAGAAGKQVRIWGYSMLKASVSFDGVAATAVRNSGPNYVFATVPQGATTGPITVTTPGGTSTTQASFTVK